MRHKRKVHERLAWLLVRDFLKSHGYYATGIDGDWSHPDQEWIFNFGYPDTPEIKIHVYLRRTLRRATSGLVLAAENNWINLCHPDSLNQLLELLSNPSWERATFWYHKKMPQEVIQVGQEELDKLCQEFNLKWHHEDFKWNSTRIMRSIVREK